MKIEARQLYRHKKSGRVYEVLGTGKMCLPHDEWVESVSYKLHSEWRGGDIYTRPMGMFSQRMELLKERMTGEEFLEKLTELTGGIDVESFEREHGRLEGE